MVWLCTFSLFRFLSQGIPTIAQTTYLGTVYLVGVCVSTPNPSGKSQILAGWGKSRSSTDILNAFIEDVNPHTEVLELKLPDSVVRFALRRRSFASCNDIKQLRILGERTALC